MSSSAWVSVGAPYLFFVKTKASEPETEKPSIWSLALTEKLQGFEIDRQEPCLSIAKDFKAKSI